jgi:hypothetical protein
MQPEPKNLLHLRTPTTPPKFIQMIENYYYY